MTDKTNINDEYELRLAKLQRITTLGKDAYPAKTGRGLEIAQYLEGFDKYLDKQNKVVLAGRIMSLRLQGGSCFMDIVDGSGRVQAFVRKDNLEAGDYQDFKDWIDHGDFVELTGVAFMTKTKQPTILVSKFKLLSKALLPLPTEYYGLKDQDLRFRKRYVDLIVNPEVKKTFVLRSQIINFIREFFNGRGYMEVDTPILQTIATGATAKPFVTHHNTLDMDLYLRVAPELYLKRLIVGGYDKVFEIARCFRNEGIDHQHNPEFSQVEAYEAYQNYEGYMEMVEKFMEALVKKIYGQTTISVGETKLNFKAPFPRLDFKTELDQALKIDIDKVSDAELVKLAQKAKLDVDKTWGRGKLLDELYKKFVRAHIVQPAFIINHPIELSPLAKKISGRPNYVERFQLLIQTAEICNAFSELNDPLDQEQRFKEQKELQDKGDDEAQGSDDDFVEALKYGMPPTAGLGIGIDRLVMILGGIENIKEVILFPTMRPKDSKK